MKRMVLCLLLAVAGLSEAQVSSPGNVVFGSPNSPTTTATFDSTGTFVLQYAASDGAKVTAKTVTVTVAAPALARVCLGSANAIAGNAADFVVVLATANIGLAGVQFDVVLPAGVSSNAVTPGPIVTAAGKSLQANMVGTSLRIIVFGVNQTTLAGGTLATINLQTAATLLAGSVPLPLANVTGTDVAGLSVPMASCNGTVVITANQAPSVTIGPNQTIVLPATANLTATMTDDGAPNPPGLLTGSWSVL